MPRPSFLFVVAQPESKQLLCEELTREHPELRLAYSRPGLYTFKQTGAEFEATFCLRSIFARHYGFSLGTASGAADVCALLKDAAQPMHLHAFGRDAGEGRPRASAASIDACREQILRSSSQVLLEEVVPRPGALILDIVLPPDGCSDEPWFVGYHRHAPRRSPHPGSVTRKDPPSNAPSRAFGKLEELLQWSSLPMRAGDTAVEIGCAPGGAVLSMLDRGLRVVGIDPAAIDPSVVTHAQEISAEFRHLACPCAAISREQLPRKVDWLLCDVNLAPQIAIRYLAHWTKILRPHLRGLIFTMKLNDKRAVASIPSIIARVAEFRLGEPRAVQLPSHRREVVVVASRGPRGA